MSTIATIAAAGSLHLLSAAAAGAALPALSRPGAGDILLAAAPGSAPGPRASSGPARPGAKGAAPKAQDYLDFPVTVQTPIQPMPVRAEDGKWYLVYELHLTNWSETDLLLKKIDIMDARQGVTFATYEGASLADTLRLQVLPPGSRTPAPASPEARTIPSGRTVVLYVNLALDTLEQIPSSLKHRAYFERSPSIRLRRDMTSDEIGDLELDVAPLPVRTDKPPVLRPPLQGGPWTVGGRFVNGTRYALVVRDGRARIPERFGCTFTLVDDKGNVLPEAPPADLTNPMFFGFGAEVQAVAEAVVAFVKDGVPDNTPSLRPPAKPFVPTRDSVSGNWISLDLGNNHYAFYSHLMIGSARVKAGDKVRAGQVIALVGNSGASEIPHLEFHVGDANAILASEGIPFVLDAFDAGADTAPGPGSQASHKLEIPLRGSSMRFP